MDKKHKSKRVPAVGNSHTIATEQTMTQEARPTQFVCKYRSLDDYSYFMEARKLTDFYTDHTEATAASPRQGR
jgi:hypothetical protein